MCNIWNPYIDSGVVACCADHNCGEKSSMVFDGCNIYSSGCLNLYLYKKTEFIIPAGMGYIDKCVSDTGYYFVFA